MSPNVHLIGPLSALAFSHTPVGGAFAKRLNGTAKAAPDDRLDFAEGLLVRGSRAVPEPEREATPV